MQMRGVGTIQPLYKGGRAGRPAAGRPGPATQLPGGQGGPAAPLPGDRPPGIYAQLFEQKFLHKGPAAPLPGGGRPAARRPGYIPVNFQIENIFV